MFEKMFGRWLRRSTNGMFATAADAERTGFDTEDLGVWVATQRFTAFNS